MIIMCDHVIIVSGHVIIVLMSDRPIGRRLQSGCGICVYHRSGAVLQDDAQHQPCRQHSQ